MQKKRKLSEGSITISRYSGEESGISIAIGDRTSGIEFLRLEMSFEAFGEAITSLSHRDCKFELRGLKNVGKRREVKNEIVYVTDPWALKDEQRSAHIREAVAVHEKNGWIGYDTDASNSHRRVKNSKVEKGVSAYNVSYTRFVDP